MDDYKLKLIIAALVVIALACLTLSKPRKVVTPLGYFAAVSAGMMLGRYLSMAETILHYHLH
jgi:hypothetical protein